MTRVFPECCPVELLPCMHLYVDQQAEHTQQKHSHQRMFFIHEEACRRIGAVLLKRRHRSAILEAGSPAAATVDRVWLRGGIVGCDSTRTRLPRGSPLFAVVLQDHTP